MIEKKLSMRNKKIIRLFIVIVCALWTLGSISFIVFDPRQRFFDRYYTEEVYKQLERLYNNSQYRLKNPTSIVADDVVFRYAAGAYVRGTDPIFVNSEHTPAGKYFLGLSFLFFKSDGPVILGSALLTLVALWLLAGEALGDRVTALIPVALFSTEELFRNQLRVTPLLDIIQLPFVLMSLYFFMLERKRAKFFWTSISLGMVAATKSVVPAILLILSFETFFVIKKEWKRGLKLVPWLLLGVAVFMSFYVKTFMDGYTIVDFFRFQKWIFLYQQSKLIFPFSFWRLILVNQWQTWWGDMSIHKTADWSVIWPFLTLVPFALVISSMRKMRKLNDQTFIILVWVFVYEAFLSVGIVVTRFLLPLLPVLYILAVIFMQSLAFRKGYKA